MHPPFSAFAAREPARGRRSAPAGEAARPVGRPRCAGPARAGDGGV